MPGKTSRTIQVVSHGPSCLDGVMAAAAVARFYDGHKVFTTLAGNNDADRVIHDLTLKSDDAGNEDEIWITDLSWNGGPRFTGSIIIAPQSPAPMPPSSRWRSPAKFSANNIRRRA
jgi:hypothetical protein